MCGVGNLDLPRGHADCALRYVQSPAGYANGSSAQTKGSAGDVHRAARDPYVSRWQILDPLEFVWHFRSPSRHLLDPHSQRRKTNISTIYCSCQAVTSYILWLSTCVEKPCWRMFGAMLADVETCASQSTRTSSSPP